MQVLFFKRNFVEEMAEIKVNKAFSCWSSDYNVAVNLTQQKLEKSNLKPFSRNLLMT